MLQSSLNLAAIMMVQNERNVIADCIGHMLHTLGVAHVYVTDNGSTDGTDAVLQWLARQTGRVTVQSDPGPFRQAEVLTALARQAAADGAAWVLPADADEFLWLRSGTTLAALCARPGIGGYRVGVRNFLQARPVRHNRTGALVTMCVSANPYGSVADAQSHVMAGTIPFVRINYPTKLLLRTSPTLELAFGHHDANGTAGPLVPLEHGEILHAPIRSFQDIHSRVQTGHRVAEVTPAPGENWHLKRLIAMDAAGLEREWQLNSFAPLNPFEPGVTRLDFRLSRIGVRHARQWLRRQARI